MITFHIIQDFLMYACPSPALRTILNLSFTCLTVNYTTAVIDFALQVSLHGIYIYTNFNSPCQMNKTMAVCLPSSYGVWIQVSCLSKNLWFVSAAVPSIRIKDHTPCNLRFWILFIPKPHNLLFQDSLLEQ